MCVIRTRRCETPFARSPCPRGEHTDVTDGSAVQFAGQEAVDVIRVDRPSPSATEVLVETTTSAISPGTELLVYRGMVDERTVADEQLPALDGTLSYPVRYGYAAVGRVVSVGRAVDPVWRGQRVFGFNPHESHFTAAPEDLLAVPDGVDTERAVFFANTETALNFMHDATPRFGERVAVFGQGVIGLLTTALLARSPVETVVAVEPHERRRRLALEMGADVTVDPRGRDAAAAVLEHTDGVDLAIEVSGQPEALETAVEATRYDGRVVVGSWYGTKRTDLGFGTHFHRGNVAIRSSQVSTISPELRGRWSRERRRDTTWQLLHSLDTEPLVTHRIAVEEAPEAYRLLDDEPNEAVQVLLTY